MTSRLCALYAHNYACVLGTWDIICPGARRCIASLAIIIISSRTCTIKLGREKGERNPAVVRNRSDQSD